MKVFITYGHFQKLERDAIATHGKERVQRAYREAGIKVLDDSPQVKVFTEKAFVLEGLESGAISNSSHPMANLPQGHSAAASPKPPDLEHLARGVYGNQHVDVLKSGRTPEQFLEVLQRHFHFDNLGSELEGFPTAALTAKWGEPVPLFGLRRLEHGRKVEALRAAMRTPPGAFNSPSTTSGKEPFGIDRVVAAYKRSADDRLKEYINSKTI